MAKDGDDEKASGSTPRVFISYASLDKAIAEIACEALEKAGVMCWISPRDVTPGAFYGDEIVHAIDAAKAIVLILSQNAATSPHVLREVERATSKRRAVISLRIDKAPLPAGLEYFLNTSQWLDASSGDTVRALPKLVSAVQVAIQAPTVTPTGVPTAHAPAPAASARSRKRMALVVASVVSLALVGFAADRLWLSSHRAAATPATTPVASAPAPVTAAPAIPQKSVAVLAFLDMSEKHDQEYFSDGLSEELIDMLAKVPDLRVPARTSSFYFKGRQTTIADVAKALGVAHVLEGSVRKSGNTVRVTAQLIRVDNGYHVWSETYDRKLEDIFKVQDEIASAVVTALKVRLLPMQPAAAQEELRTENLEAYNLYLQGRQSFNQGDLGGYQGAVTAFRAATAMDPRYAAAYADLALAQFWLTNDTETDSDTIDLPGWDSALADAEKAIALAPGLAAGYAARGFVRAIYRFDFAGGQVDLDKAVALSPRDADVLHRSAVLLSILGKLPAAIAREEQALALDPLSAEICMRLGFFLVANQQLAQARPLYEKALAIAPNSSRAQYHLAELELLEHQPERALAMFRQMRTWEFSLSGQAKAEYSLGHDEVSERILKQLIAKKAAPFMVASVYAWRGETDKAFQWAERAYRERDAGITWLEIDFNFRGLRGDPRYKALLRKMNLPE